MYYILEMVPENLYDDLCKIHKRYVQYNILKTYECT